MAAFESIISALRLQDFISLFLPYIVVFLVIGGLIYYLTGFISSIRKLDSLYRKVIRLVIAVVLGSILSIFVSGAIQMFIPL
jgi:tetrahydromethanopterin S-methyltransferase subunit C